MPAGGFSHQTFLLTTTGGRVVVRLGGADHGIEAADWLYLGRVLDMFALSGLVTDEHLVADRAARVIRRWVADGVPRDTLTSSP